MVDAVESIRAGLKGIPPQTTLKAMNEQTKKLLMQPTSLTLFSLSWTGCCHLVPLGGECLFFFFIINILPYLQGLFSRHSLAISTKR